MTLGGNASLDANTAVNLGNAVNLGANTLSVLGSNATTLGGVISGSGALVKTAQPT